MRQLFLIFMFGAFSLSLYGQDVLENLVKIGIDFHDKGDYENAINIYKKALIIDPNSALANYEIAMTYMYTRDFENCVKHSDLVLNLDGEYVLPAYVTKGSCLDNLGRTDESIALFKKGLKKFGDHYLLYYNLGYNFYQINEFRGAEEALINAIHSNVRHASSHLLLGYLMNDQDHRVESLLCLYYFLLLEPASIRAKEAYELLLNQYNTQVKWDNKDPDQINIFFDPDTDCEFGAANMMISMLEATHNTEQNDRNIKEKLFIENTRTFFTFLGELQKKKYHGLWWEFYIPFFSELAKSDYIDAYCFYISQASSKNSQKWLVTHVEKLNQFINWLQHYQQGL